MKCNNCGKECRMGFEIVGYDNKKNPIRYKFAYCDYCKIKFNTNIPEKKNVLKDNLGLIALIFSILGLITFPIVIGVPISLLALILSMISLNNKNKYKKCGIVATIISGILLAIATIIIILFSTFLSSSNEQNNSTEVKNINVKNEEIIKEEYFTEIYNQNDVIISFESMKDNETEIQCSFIINNNSLKDYSFSPHSYGVNGLMAGGLQYTSDIDVPAGKNGRILIEIEKEWMRNNNIEKIANIDIIFWAYYEGMKEWDTGKIDIKTGNYREENLYNINQNEIYKDQYVVIWYIPNKEKELRENEYEFIIKNTSECNASFDIENITINDWAYDYRDIDLYNNCIHKDSFKNFIIEIDSEFVENNSLEKIKTLEFDVIIEDDYDRNKKEKWEHKTERIIFNIE